MDKKIEDALWPACYPEGSDPEGIVSCLTAAGYVIVPKKSSKEMLDRAMPHMDSWSSNMAWWDKMIGADQ